MKYNFFRICFFSFLFLLTDFRYISIDKYSGSYSVLSEAIMSTSVGYNNLFLIVGIVVTSLYVFGLSNILIESPLILIKCGKNRFYNKNIKNIFFDSLLIAIEYVGIIVAFCLCFFDITLLYDSGFFLCVLLYCAMLCMYFFTVGSVTLLIKILMGSKIYVFVSAVIFFVLAALQNSASHFSPVYFCNFVDRWFLLGKFDIIDYVKDLMICLLYILIAILFGKLTFSKKDFWHEQT